MDYRKIYNKIVERAQYRKLESYVEKHHIIPKCIGGLDIKENIVELTAREHFLCHMLLCEIYPNENKLKHALFLMAIGKQKIKEKTYVIGSRVYERLKEEYSTMLKGIKQSQETKNKKSKSMLNVWDNKTNEEKSIIGKKRWETRRKNGTDKVHPNHAGKISRSLKGKKRLSTEKYGKAVQQFDLEGNFITEYFNAQEAERKLGKQGKNNIQNAAGNRQKTAYGFIWKYKN
jgi:hypothetical protein